MFECFRSLDPHLKAAFTRLSEETVFSYGEVRALWRRFKAWGGSTLNTTFVLEELEVGIPELQTNPYNRRMMEVFSEDGSSKLNFEKLVRMLSALNERTPVEEKSVWAFALMDFDGDGELGPKDVFRAVRTLTSKLFVSASDLAVPSALLAANMAAEGDHAVSPKGIEAEAGSTLSARDVAAVTKRIFDEVDPAAEGLTFMDFQAVLARKPQFMENFMIHAI